MFALARCLLQVMLVYNRGKQCKHCCCKNVCLEWGLMTHQAKTCFDKTGLFTKKFYSFIMQYQCRCVVCVLRAP